MDTINPDRAMIIMPAVMVAAGLATARYFWFPAFAGKTFLQVIGN